MALKKAVEVTLVAFGLALGTPAIAPWSNSAFAQRLHFESARQVVSKTQIDLDRAARFLQNNKKEQERLRNAQKHLSELDRHLVKGKFDKSTLDSAIGDIQSVLDHNVLQGDDRDVLMRDISDLRTIRTERG